ncbi:S-layer homology domain-containing protein [Paenibacillus tuaregi]|uniref:S-layer homology domain-containing protein n=1 Tax=Paenibacillus tuaregi TaxID=1816681 RepID=UPI000837CBBC|nr:S-layer homology domain-containing protein [Paenibacillus tuaregi]
MKYILKRTSFIVGVTLTLQAGMGSFDTSTALAAGSTQSPTVITAIGSAAFTAGNNTSPVPVTIDSSLTITDPDSITLESATVAITGNFRLGEDVLRFINNGATMGNIVGSYNTATGVLTLTSIGATATLSEWQSALRSVAYTNVAITPNTSPRTISFSAYDGTNNSNSAARAVTVTAVNQTPIVTTSGGPATFTAGPAATPVAIDSVLIVTDSDNTTLSSATVSLTGNFHSGQDVLGFSNDGTTMGNIVGSYNSGTGVLTLTSSGATATLSQWQGALRSVTYSNTSIAPNTLTRTISFSVSDGTNSSNGATKTVDVTLGTVNQAPSVAASGGSTTFTAEDDTASIPVAVDPGLTVADPDSPVLKSGVVTITGNFHSGEDGLAFTNDGVTMGNISGTYDQGTGVLTLTSPDTSATLAQWQSALRSVVYTNKAAAPHTAARTISFYVNDGVADSGSVSKNVTIKALKSITAKPQTVSVQAGQTASVAISALYSEGPETDVTSKVKWTVQSPELASISNGTITGLKAGTTVITAVYGTQSVGINLTVTPKPIVENPNPGSNPTPNPNPVPPSSSSDNPIPVKPPAAPDPVVLPSKKPSAFSNLVDLDRLKDAVQKALESGKSTGFKDTASHWANNDIALASRLGIVNGYGNGTFKPDAPVTRAEISALVVKAFALEQGSGVNTYPDIKNSWAREFIEVLASKGILSSYPDGKFRADEQINRAEMVSILSKIVTLQDDKSALGNRFIDVAPEYWDSKNIEGAAAAGLIQGVGVNRFLPNGRLTRAEAITVIIRMLKQDPVIKGLLQS